ncbi:hypothetical protein JX265_000556 [Neoarthrinium moseri]|uniref:Calcineurin-like phosphoesterase domain-containing protein n=1 Tax=Neoarthrinium moseri TaxID=1658444 RepID=A0A9Q0AX05_9PEZI|nr:hypothetical protein JX265_000556 [Neoarthrinium moseri]
MEVRTRFLIVSDTHGDSFGVHKGQRADVAIHCGDLTEESKISELRTTLRFLAELDAPLKLVIPGNHDFTLDVPTFRRRVAEAAQPLEPELVSKEFGDYGEARSLFEETKKDGIIFLDEGNHEFTLANGAQLKIYASPFTPSKGGWGFQYAPETGHQFSIDQGVDVVITHGPPLGVMDLTDSRVRGWCPDLFGAVARARPRMHCFGHIHEGWGAKLVTWRDKVSEKPSHFTDIDNSRSVVVEKLTNILPNRFDDADSSLEKELKARAYLRGGGATISHCKGDEHALQVGYQTLFVNAAIEGTHDALPYHPAWIVDLDLRRSGN